MSLTLPILLLALGLVLVFAEVFFVSMGILAVLAAGAFVGACVSAFAISTDVGIYFLIAVSVLAPTATMTAFHLLPRSPWGRRLISRGLSFGAEKSFDDRDLELVGQAGVAEGPLRPAGFARIDGRRVDVVSRGELIDHGEPIQVLEVSGNRVVVGRAPSTASAPTPQLPERP